MILIKDYYKILGVDKYATKDEIQAAYKKLAKEHHPDHHREEDRAEAEERTKEINNAYDILKDDVKRIAYNFAMDNQPVAPKGVEVTYRDFQYGIDNVQPVRRKAYDFEEHRTPDDYVVAEEDEDLFIARDLFKSKRHIVDEEFTGDEISEGMDEEDMEEYTDNGEKRRTPRKTYRKPTALDNIKTSVREVKEEEAKNPFSKRTARVSKKYAQVVRGPRNAVSRVMFNIGLGTVEVTAELMHQLSKFKYITEDSIPKYVFRNRKLLAAGLIVATLANVGNKLDDSPKKDTSVDDSYSISSTYETEGEHIQEGIHDTSSIEIQTPEEDHEVTQFTIFRNYVVQPGDTISQLAANANCTQNDILEINSIKSANSINYGRTITIPYKFSSDELDYYVCCIDYDSAIPVSEYAKTYSTDLGSLRRLNEEAFDDQRYIANTILVPVFPPRFEVVRNMAADAATNQK